MAHKQCAEIADIAGSGTSLAFIMYAEAFDTFGASKHFFAFIFFLTLFLLGVDSSVAWLESINSFITDLAAERGIHLSTWAVALFSCVSVFLGGLLFCTRAGNYYLDIFDHFCATYVLLVNAILEIILIGWVYGAQRFMDDIQKMLPWVKLSVFWLIDWKFLCPAMVVALLALGIEDESKKAYGGYPDGYQVLGWATVIGPLLIIAISAFFPLSDDQIPSMTYGDHEKDKKDEIDADEDWTADDDGELFESTVPPRPTKQDVHQPSVSQLPQMGSFNIDEPEPQPGSGAVVV